MQCPPSCPNGSTDKVDMKHAVLLTLCLTPVVLSLAACGGGDDEVATEDTMATAAEAESETANAAGGGLAKTLAARATINRPRVSPSPAPAPAPATAAGASVAERIAAATATAQSSTNACAPVRPFYWEIGSRDGKQASGSVNSTSSTVTVTSTMPITLASASKWIYGAYVAQKRNGVLSSDDRAFLSMRRGYNSFESCLQNQTVAACQAYGTNGVYTASTDNKFDYGGGHMQKHASSLMGLGAMNSKTLAGAIQSQIGTDVKLAYSSPQLAGGGIASPAAYALFLRKLLTGQLVMGNLLGSNPVCTNKLTCGTTQAIFAPIPPTESWHYSVGHWVEDDPVLGDGAFSSPGAFGFYPWIDASRTTYGVLARVAPMGAFDSVQCGRLIRKAWTSATAL
ncbi:hypothetical protein [Aquabacterium sp.]|uniref:hypothetical protein n=1 Tax=Aquabacterium sp. TaxID=1872578 RepID=UPI002C05DB30|nr:hypothetical protein [Aquabacterium sp.]HSW05264.1 hypothetical protein [Aquabacterium sp.]